MPKIFNPFDNLAQNLMSNTCAKLIGFLKQIIASPHFVDRHRHSV